jgi:hypothetical protein
MRDRAGFRGRRCYLARVEVELDAVGTDVAGSLDEAGGGIDRARGADRHEQVAGSNGFVDAVHVIGHLAEPDDVRTNLAGGAAGRAECPLPHRFRPGKASVAGQAPALLQFAMHVDEALRSGALVQVIDVLGHQQKIARPAPLQIGEGKVGGVRLDRAELGTACIVEIVHKSGIAAERFGRRNVFHPVPLPQAVRAAEGGDAAVGRDAGTGQDDDRSAVLLAFRNHLETYLLTLLSASNGGTIKTSCTATPSGSTRPTSTTWVT